MTTPPQARTPLYHWHVAHAARLAEREGWQVAQGYADSAREVAAARAAAGLADLSACAKLGFRGPGVGELVRALVGDGPAAQPRGVSDFWLDGTVLACRLSADALLLLGSTPAAAPIEKHLAERKPAALLSTQETSALACIGLVGPHSVDLLRRLTSFDASPVGLPEGACAETRLAGVYGLIVRPAHQPVPAFRLCVAWDLGEHLWEAMLDAGRHLGIVPIGLEAWHRLLSAC